MNLRKMITTALLIALGVLLPMAFHTVANAGAIFLPMHIPVLICGLVCGWQYGLICGILTPLLSNLLTQMPPAAFLPQMLCELAAYGLISGLLYRFELVKNKIANVYISLIGAMLGGRLLYGVLNALIFSAGKYSMQLWLTAAFVKALPGIAIQIVIIPVLVIALDKSGLVRKTA